MGVGVDKPREHGFPVCLYHFVGPWVAFNNLPSWADSANAIALNVDRAVPDDVSLRTYSND